MSLTAPTAPRGPRLATFLLPGFVALLALSSLGCSAERSLKTADGRRRVYRIHVPKGVEKPAPLVLALHGGGGSAEGTQSSLGLDALADEKGFIAVYPEGIGKVTLGKMYATWNSDEQCCGEALKQGVDDVAFISQLIDTLVAEEGVDPARVYATGISNGGAMSHRLGCELAGKLAAIAPTAAPRIVGTCAPSRPVPVMILHGTLDGCAPYEDTLGCGGCFARALESVGLGQVDVEDTFKDCLGARSQHGLWRARNGCGPTSTVTYQRGDVRCETFSDGCAQAPATLCTIEGGGHTTPGTTHGCDEKRAFCQAFIEAVGPISQDISLREVWDFFAAHRLP